MSTLHEKIPVSVVIPCYRCKDTIVRALASVAAQTALPAEVILVEDQSGDDTLQRLKEIAKQYPENWIRVLEQKVNAGPGSARNVGWESAQNPYIAFLDSDDSWHPQKLEIQYSWMKTHPDVALTGHGTQQVEGTTAPNDKVLAVVDRPVIAKKLLFSNQFPTRSVMLRRDVPFRFFPGKRHSEDYLLWLTIVLNGHKAYVLEAPLAYSFKSDYGDAGLSAQLWKHEKGELDMYRRLKNDGLVSVGMYYPLLAFSFLKYLRRVLITAKRSRSARA
ncbi:glycosyltransferase family 2 protein [Bdellovibrio sp. HCB337]|uniref:glycosyltransferase family 2 protein n=1 Tax=Bdellovibrio sp. HCB337 TaxID=3394358 RepID=UPI0039A6FD18